MQYHWPLIGHHRIKEYFTKAFAQGRIHHAYLFEGPAHVGKFTFATMLAKTLICEGTNEIVPCEICRACQAFTRGVHPDCVWLTQGEKPSVSIEEVREFIHTLSTKPLLSKVRIGILEDAASVTEEASHALLKTLEEPSLHVVLFLVTSTPLLPTIASRCQTIRFGLVSEEELQRHVASLPDAQTIVASAGGRPGLALAMQDPLVYSAYKASLQDVAEVLASDEPKRLLWTVREFGGTGADRATRRDAAREFIDRSEQFLRERLHFLSLDKGKRPEGGFVRRLVADSPVELKSARTILHKIESARGLLRANVDPRLVCEYLLLEHE